MKRREFVKQTVAAGAVLAAAPSCSGRTPPAASVASRTDFNPGWRFLLDDVEDAWRDAFDDGTWSAATLPHTARIEALVTGEPGSDTYQWQGIWWYRRRFRLSPEQARGKVFLKFDGAMNVADA